MKISKPLLLAALHILITSNCWAVPLKDQKMGFFIEIPPNWTEVKSAAPGVGLALRYEQGPYPTFNIVRSAGSVLVTDSTAEKLAQSVADDYRLVGLTDAKVTSYEVVSHSQGPRLSVTLAYDYDGTPLTAQVMLVSAPSWHYILTLIDRRNAELPLRNRAAFMESFTVTERSPLHVQASAPSRSSAGIPFPYLLPTLLGLVVVVLVVLVSRGGRR